MKFFYYIFLITFFIISNEYVSAQEKIKLTQVTQLTLFKSLMTNGRRLPPVKQLECVGGSAGCSTYKPEQVTCFNRGTDGFNVQWECVADLDNSVKFGEMQVSCEGYEDSSDPYVLVGSCGLKYNLDYVNGSSGSTIGAWIIGIIFFVIIGVICACVFSPSFRESFNTTNSTRTTPCRSTYYSSSTPSRSYSSSTRKTSGFASTSNR